MAFIQTKLNDSAVARRRPQHWSALIRNFGYVCWVFAGLAVVFSIFLAYGQYSRMTKWRPAQGTVLQREVYWDYSRNSKGGNSVVYGVRFAFRYSLDGRDCVGSADLGFRSGFRSWVEYAMERLPVGASREIRVNPDAPSELSLASDFGLLSFAAAYFAFALAMLTFAFGVTCWWAAARFREAGERRRAVLAVP